MEIGLPKDGDFDLHRARVTKHMKDNEGKPIGTAHKNPLLDTRQYEVMYLDRTTETMTANIIAENLLAQVDKEGHRQLMIDEIIDHRKNEQAIKKSHGFFMTRVRT